MEVKKMYCRHCGKKILDDSKFCRYCGSNVVERDICSGNNNKLATNDDGNLETLLNSYYPNIHFKEIYNFLITKVPKLKIIKKKSTLCFYSFSSKNKKKRILGLAWIYYPRSADSFKLYLRNISYIKYPESLTKKLWDYKINNRNYPITSIKNESDVQTIKELIQFAYDNY